MVVSPEAVICRILEDGSDSTRFRSMVAACAENYLRLAGQPLESTPKPESAIFSVVPVASPIVQLDQYFLQFRQEAQGLPKWTKEALKTFILQQKQQKSDYLESIETMYRRLILGQQPPSRKLQPQ